MGAPLTIRETAMPGGGWPFGALVPFSYDLLMVDPPYPTVLRSPKGEAKSSMAKYGAMPWPAIEALPIGQLAARDCLLWLWCTWPLLLDGGDPRAHFVGADASRSPVGACLKRWGFRYVTGGAWLKRRSRGGVSFGTGYRLRSACEPFLIGITGSPVTSRSVRNFVDGLAREHSRKPEEAYAACEQLMHGARYAELFSRTSRPRWDCWGLQAGMFDPVVRLNAVPLADQVAA
ncbi:MAG TPA: MT-A70 family methyltransferase [Xanthobacteraceae bacterium]|jgi:N6-adenosine-specific RNA methylase IME4|nr:MT-A70 family methyltransferase [Xanthobacteraceae bacterium]